MAKKKADSLGLFKEYGTAEEALSAVKSYFQKSEDFSQYVGEADLALAIKIPLAELRSWQDGKRGDDFKQVADWAYMKIASSFETDVKANEDKVFARKAIKMMEQDRFQGYKAKQDDNKDVNINVKFGPNTDQSDFL